MNSNKFSLPQKTLLKLIKYSLHCYENSKQNLNSVKLKKHLNTKYILRHKDEKRVSVLERLLI